MKFAIFVLCIVLLFAVPVLSDFNRTSSLIDIPSAKILPHLGYRVGIDVSFALDAEHSADDRDENLHAAMGFGNNFEAYLDIYTIRNFTAAFGFCHKLYDKGNLAFGWGIHSLSYAMDVSEVGHGDSVGWDDDLSYSSEIDYEKPFELGSAFLVSTYSPTKILDLTIGLGRGRYVGYGPNSKWFNSNFYHDKGGDWAIGVILGMEYKPTKNLSFLIDLDGRDANIGLKFRYLPIELGLAIAKAEQFGLKFSPRISASISYVGIKGEKEVKPGIIAGIVTDEENACLVATVRILYTDRPKVITESETGTFRFDDLKPGIYEVYALSEGYINLSNKVTVTSDKTTYVEFRMKRKERETGDFIGNVFDIETKAPVVAKLSLIKIELTVTSEITGLFEFNNLEPGVYEIKAEAEGYETGYYPEVIESNEKTEVEIGMVKRGAVITLKGIKFDFNKAIIKPESYPILDEAADILKTHPDIKVELQGHTDSVGSDAYNLKLSDARAKSVRDYMIQKHNIDASRLSAQGYGERKPIGDNRTKEGRNQNRRVDFHILK